MNQLLFHKFETTFAKNYYTNIKKRPIRSKRENESVFLSLI